MLFSFIVFVCMFIVYYNFSTKGNETQMEKISYWLLAMEIEEKKNLLFISVDKLSRLFDFSMSGECTLYFYLCQHTRAQGTFDWNKVRYDNAIKRTINTKRWNERNWEETSTRTANRVMYIVDFLNLTCSFDSPSLPYSFVRMNGVCVFDVYEWSIFDIIWLWAANIQRRLWMFCYFVVLLCLCMCIYALVHFD